MYTQRQQSRSVSGLMYIHSDYGVKTNAELMYDRCPSEGECGVESDSKAAQRPD